MRIIECKCPSCGSNLNINNDTDFFNCDSCGASLYVERIIRERVNEHKEDIEFFKDFKDLLSMCDEMIYKLRMKNIEVTERYQGMPCKVDIFYPVGLQEEKEESKTYGRIFNGLSIYDDDIKVIEEGRNPFKEKYDRASESYQIEANLDELKNDFERIIGKKFSTPKERDMEFNNFLSHGLKYRFIKNSNELKTIEDKYTTLVINEKYLNSEYKRKLDIYNGFTNEEIDLIKKYCFLVKKASEYANVLREYVADYKANERFKSGTYTMKDISNLPVGIVDSFSKEKNAMSKIKNEVSKYDLKDMISDKSDEIEILQEEDDQKGSARY